jgi:hypothetical protein
MSWWTDPDKTDEQNNLAQQQKLGLFTAVFGGLTSAVGSFYAAKTAQYQEQSQAMTARFQGDMAKINARQAEYSAESTLNAAESQVGKYTMEAGAKKASTTASLAASGVSLGVGNARDIIASEDLQKSIDVLTINSNAARTAAAQRMQGTNYSNTALMDYSSAHNADVSAGSISPMSAMTTSLIGSATSISSNWMNKQYLRLIARQQGASASPYGGSF